MHVGNRIPRAAVLAPRMQQQEGSCQRKAESAPASALPPQLPLSGTFHCYLLQGIKRARADEAELLHAELEAVCAKKEWLQCRILELESSLRNAVPQLYLPPEDRPVSSPKLQTSPAPWARESTVCTIMPP